MRKLVLLTAMAFLTPLVFAEQLSTADADYITKVVSNIDKYVTWPEKNFEGNGQLLVITVVGKSSVNGPLVGLNGQAASNGKKFKVREVELADMPANSHLLVVADSNASAVQKALSLLKDRGTLVMGTAEGFAQLGCMINFAKSAGDGTKVGIEINATTLKEGGFQVNPALRKMAKVIE